jgi:hypothetical protein
MLSSVSRKGGGFSLLVGSHWGETPVYELGKIYFERCLSSQILGISWLAKYFLCSKYPNLYNIVLKKHA